MQFIDTHIHLQDYKQNSATDIVALAESLAIKKLICVSAQEEDWQKVSDFYNKYPNIIIPAFGIHPWYAGQVQPGWENRLEALLEQIPAALVGECGLDGIRNPQAEPQNQVFEKQIKLAVKMRRTLLIHAIKAHNWLENYWKILPQKFVMHSYNGRAELLKKALSYGAYISFSGSILTNKYKEKLINMVPPTRLLVETDGPYQSLQLGQETSLNLVLQLVSRLAEIRNDNQDELASKIYENSLEMVKKW